MAFVITSPCVGVCDTACVDVCPVDCIHPAEGYDINSESDLQKMCDAGEQLYIDPAECIDCGACVAECPVNAIFEEDEVPDSDFDFIKKNADRFA